MNFTVVRRPGGEGVGGGEGMVVTKEGNRKEIFTITQHLSRPNVSETLQQTAGAS